MALCTILRLGNTRAEQNAFAFEHDMAHRTLLAAMPNVAQLSVLPYQIDPAFLTNRQYLLKHQQAHWDMRDNLAVAPPIGENFIDTIGNVSWWTFANHQEHMAALKTLPPNLATPYSSDE